MHTKHSFSSSRAGRSRQAVLCYTVFILPYLSTKTIPLPALRAKSFSRTRPFPALYIRKERPPVKPPRALFLSSFAFRPRGAFSSSDRQEIKLLPRTFHSLSSHQNSDEKSFTPNAARRWAACSRFLFRPRFLHSAIPLPRVVTLVFCCLLLFRPRGAFPAKLGQKWALVPLSRGYRGGRAVPAAPSGPSLFLYHTSCPGYFSSVLFHLCFAPSNVERGARGNHRRFPLLLSLPFQRERKK